ncbi:MAG: RNA helicase [Aerococcus sp.]|nr:RNA helicase [Aerococcus sp.]
MKTLRIMLDFTEGPLWKDFYDMDTKELCTGIEVVDNDEELQKLNDEIQDLYGSYYKFDYHDLPCYFDEEQEKKDKDKMLFLLGKLKDRLNEINDGSFVIDDQETERVKNL